MRKVHAMSRVAAARERTSPGPEAEPTPDENMTATQLDMPVGRPSRTVIESPYPTVDAGRFPAKRALGDVVCVRADVFTEGHDRVAAAVRWRHDLEAQWHETMMTPLVNDRFEAKFVADRLGTYWYTIGAWVDEFATWLSAVRLRIDAHQDVRIDLLEGVQLLERSLGRTTTDDRRLAERLIDDLSHGRLAAIDDPSLPDLLQRLDRRASFAQLERALPVLVERERGRFSSWYELFPRSTSTDPSRPGTLADAIDRLPYVASMGFDVVYLPPVHPIGRSHRKGRNNATVATADDVGSPWAIGAAEGGHEAIHPALGTLDDFRQFVVAAEQLGMEVALDLALQCSPDHPWVHEHPTWFKHRPDGSIRTAENPPKRYEDIYPLDFDSADWQELWLTIADLVETWIERGIKIFRVDNPHTKPFAFWEWLLATTRQNHPDVIFLSEAFTRPKVMHRLAKLGFSQSYTYFAWRHSAAELREYFTELRIGETPEYFRPNAWPNTPDILTEQLQHGTRGTFIARVVLASMLCANYGIYGPVYELALREPRAGSEEYLDNEKYEVRWWDLDQQHSLRHVITALNRARNTHRALQTDTTLRFHPTDNPQLLCFSKTAEGGAAEDEFDPPIVVVVNTDTWHPQMGHVDLDVAALGLATDEPFVATDILGGGRYTWHPGRNYVELDSLRQPAHVFALTPRARADSIDPHSLAAGAR
jgi:starch synthase (maltosyl-transferring)